MQTSKHHNATRTGTLELKLTIIIVPKVNHENSHVNYNNIHYGDNKQRSRRRRMDSEGAEESQGSEEAQ